MARNDSPSCASTNAVMDAHATSRLSKDVPYYRREVVFDNGAREVLEHYSRIKPDKVDEHVLAMRDKMWDVFPYPCVGEFGFLDLNLCQRAAYPDIVRRLKSSQSARHLDIGCCVGQDIRKLVYDGVLPQQIVGIELQQGFVSLGFELFRDAGSLDARFVIADMLADTDTGDDKLVGLYGSADTVHIGHVLHLFSREQQVKFLQRVITLCKSQPGVVIVGHCIGNVKAGPAAGAMGSSSMRHNVESWTQLWEELSKLTGSGWELRTALDDKLGYGPSPSGWRDPNWRRLVFEVVRQETA